MTVRNTGSLRVVHTVPALFTHGDGIVGGAERYVLELARHMADVVPTRLVTFGARRREERVGNLTITVIGDPWFVKGQRTNPVALQLLPFLVRADVIHCHQQHVLASSLAAITARASGRRVFCTDLGGGGWDVSAHISTDRWYHGHLHISAYSRAIFGHAWNPRARVILGGVDVERFSPAPALATDGPILFVGRLLPHKGIDVLVRALTLGRRAEIVGPRADPRYAADLEVLAAEKAVRFRHDCDDRALVDAYRRASCIVLPSVYRDRYGHETQVPELLGQTLLEGMAAGLPAICTNVASLPEIVKDGVTGIVVPPNDAVSLSSALVWLSGHPDDARAMGRAARQRAEEVFQWPAVVRRCLDAYEGTATRELVAAARRTAAT